MFGHRQATEIGGSQLGKAQIDHLQTMSLSCLGNNTGFADTWRSPDHRAEHQAMLDQFLQKLRESFRCHACSSSCICFTRAVRTTAHTKRLLSCVRGTIGLDKISCENAWCFRLISGYVLTTSTHRPTYIRFVHYSAGKTSLSSLIGQSPSRYRL